MTPKLAIVVPAYKSSFLKETLQSICDQTDQRFTLYIFDDASPFPIQDIVERFSFECQVFFKRFEENVGSESLTKQWERCIEETGEEEWIWLFSDDDWMSPDCVSSFFQALDESPGYAAYRFDTKKISAGGEIIRENRFPNEFDGAEFLNEKLSYNQESYIVEYLFSRRVFQDIGGFPELPMAWTADDLFCVKLAEHGQIRSIENGIVKWRYSDSNISGRQNKKEAQLKMRAAATFVQWIYEQPDLKNKLKPGDLPTTWFIRQIRSLLDQLSLIDQLIAIKRISIYSNSAWRTFFRMKINQSKIYGWLKRF